MSDDPYDPDDEDVEAYVYTLEELQAAIENDTTFIYIEGDIEIPAGTELAYPNSRYEHYLDIIGGTLTVNGSLTVPGYISIGNDLIVGSGTLTVSGTAEGIGGLYVDRRGTLWVTESGSIGVYNTDVLLTGGSVKLEGSFNYDLDSWVTAYLYRYYEMDEDYNPIGTMADAVDALLAAIPENLRPFCSVFCEDYLSASDYKDLIDTFAAVQGSAGSNCFESIHIIIYEPWTITEALTIPEGVSLEVYADVTVAEGVTVTNNGTINLYYGFIWDASKGQMTGNAANTASYFIQLDPEKEPEVYLNEEVGGISANLPFLFSWDRGPGNSAMLATKIFWSTEEPASAEALRQFGQIICNDAETCSMVDGKFSVVLRCLVPGETYYYTACMYDNRGIWYTDEVGSFTVPESGWDCYTQVSLDTRYEVSTLEKEQFYSFTAPESGYYVMEMKGYPFTEFRYGDGSVQQNRIMFFDESDTDHVFFYAKKGVRQIFYVTAYDEVASFIIRDNASDYAVPVTTKEDGKYSFTAEGSSVYSFTVPETGIWQWAVPYYEGPDYENSQGVLRIQARSAVSDYISAGLKYPDWTYDEELDEEFFSGATIELALVAGDVVYLQTDDYDGASVKVEITFLEATETDFTITYELNGGENSEYNPDGYTALDDTIVLEEAERTGYTFAGWYTDDQFKTAITEIVTGSYGNLTLYAKWTANEYTIEFDGNETGSGTMQALVMTYDTAAALPANTFVCDGYTFEGWNTEPDGNGTAYADRATVLNLTTEAGETITLYAQWAPITYTITYVLDGGENSEYNPESYSAMDDTIELEAPERAGYTFAG